jgi:hypothetical protein
MFFHMLKHLHNIIYHITEMDLTLIYFIFLIVEMFWIFFNFFLNWNISSIHCWKFINLMGPPQSFFDR